MIVSSAPAGDDVNVTGLTPAWLKTMVWPLMVIVPLRATPRLGCTVYDTEPLPEPLGLEGVSTIQGA